MKIQVFKQVPLAKPVMFAAWPGMGNVALGAINYLRKKLAMVRFAQFDTTAYYTPEGITVEAGIGQLPTPPKSIFYYRQEPDVILLENEVQFGGKMGVDFAHEVIDFAQGMGVSRIFTGAAFPVPASYKEKVQLYGVVNNESSLDMLRQHRIKIMQEGSVSGLNGLLLGYAQKKKIESLCILATMPIYATGFPNPRAWRALVEFFGKVLNTTIELRDLDFKIDKIDAKMEQIESRLEEMLGFKEKSSEKPGEEKVSQYVLNKIERLFQEARSSREKALELKRELDRWGLFEMYEDRFLDLFKKD